VWTFVAPVVLIVATLVVVNLVQGALTEDDGAPEAAAGRTTATATARTAAATAPAATTAPTRTARRAAARAAPKVYVVRAGDTLGAIAERFDTSTAALRELNPDLDPSAMQVGDRVRVAS
jgi:LysM repeat protein